MLAFFLFFMSTQKKMSKVPTWEEYVKKSGLSEQQALTVVETVEEMSAKEREVAFTGIIVICRY
jgi:hypothetical protein